MAAARDHTDGEQRAHQAALAAIMAAWRNGEIDVVTKRRKMAAENQLFYSGPKRGEADVSLTSTPSPTAPYAALLAEQMNVPLKTAQAALAARRAASVRAQYASTVEDGKAIRDAGIARYNAILGEAIGATGHDRPTLPMVMPAEEEERDEWFQR